MTIRKIESLDNEMLAKVIRAIFIEHNAPQIGTVYSDPTTDDLYSVFKKEKSVLWVALVEDEIVGCCGIYPTQGLPDGYAELVKFYLSNKARGKGIGKELMTKSIESAKVFGYKKLYIESLPEYAKAVSIYEKQGFIRLEKPLGESGHASCTIWMLKEL